MRGCTRGDLFREGLGSGVCLGEGPRGVGGRGGAREGA